MLKTITLENGGIRRLALGCLLLLFVYEVYVVQAEYSNYFVFVFESETLVFSAISCLCFGLSFLILFVWIRTALSVSWPYKALFFLIFSLSITIEYGYQKALGRFTDPQDIETAIAATGNQQTASILMYASLATLVPCFGLLALLIFVRKEKPKGLRAFLIANGILVVSFAVFPFVVGQRFPTISTGAFFRTTTEFLVNGPITSGKWGSDLTGVEVRRRTVSKPNLAPGFIPKNNVVVIVDESVRGDHFSLNGYQRETTPFLDKLASQKKLQNWGIAAAASTGSRFTYSSLITGLGPDDFPDRSGFKVNTFPTIYQYAKAMNYRTHYLDGQMNVYWGGVKDDLNYIDNWRGLLDVTEGMGFETWEIDNNLARKVRDIIYSSTGNLIFVFKHGAHIPYQGNFPPGTGSWNPSYETSNKFDIPAGDQLSYVVNAYDNSLRYNVNSFFANLIDDYSAIPNGTVIIYTGDHGQTLFVNGRSSHGGNTKAEATVPLLMIGDPGRILDTSYKASHGNIFPTILDLIEYPKELRDVSRFPSLLDAKVSDSRQRFFSPDLGVKVPFD